MATVMKVMSQVHGHKTLEFDAVRDPDSTRVELAEREFNDLINGAGRFKAYNVTKVGGRRTAEEITAFPPTREKAPEDHAGPVLEDVEELLLVPPLAGGA